jgi:AcrR family transcriptional regulator
MAPDPSLLRETDRARIREALLDLCLERGFTRTDLAMLLERAGVDEATFHRGYADLESCLCAIFMGARDDLYAKVEAALEGKAEWRERIRATAYAFLDFLDEDPRVTHLALVDVRTAGSRAQALSDQSSQFFLDLLDEARTAGTDQKMSRATAEAILGGIQALIVSAVSAGRPLDRQTVPEMMYMAVLPYLGREAAVEELNLSPPDH